MKTQSDRYLLLIIPFLGILNMFAPMIADAEAHADIAPPAPDPWVDQSPLFVATTTTSKPLPGGGEVTIRTSHSVTGTLTVLDGLIDVVLWNEPEGASTTEVVIAGLDPDQEYHLYRDSYENHTMFNSSADGTYSFAADLFAPQSFWIQDEPSTIRIYGDDGADCTIVGTWDADTRTCTLTQDVHETVELYGGTSGEWDGTTLDGAGHTLFGTGGGIGLDLHSIDNAVVRNITIDNFSLGIRFGRFQVSGSSDAEVHDVTIRNIGLALGLTATTRAHIHDVFIENASERTISVYASRDIVLERITGTNAAGIHLQGDRIRLENPTLRDITISGTSVPLNFGNVLGATLKNVHLSSSDPSAEDGAYVTFSGRDAESFGNDIDSSNTIDGKPIRYFEEATDETIDASGAAVVICAFCEGVTIHGGTFVDVRTPIVLYRTHNSIIEDMDIEGVAAGVTLVYSSNNTIRNTTIRDSDKGISLQPDLTYSRFSSRTTGPSEGNVIEDSVFSGLTTAFDIVFGIGNVARHNVLEQSAQIARIWHGSFASDASQGNRFYQNSIVDPPDKIFDVQNRGENNLFYEELPLGGNHWGEYDEPAEGCEDNDGDRICDKPYSGVTVDEYPWTHAGAWVEPQNAPTLSLPSEFGFDSVRGVKSTGPNPERGTADRDVFTFKVIYTNEANVAPNDVTVHIKGNTWASTSPREMTLDVSAQDSLLRDGDYTNGEQYTYALAFPKDRYVYYFTTSDGTSEVRWPEEGELDFRTGYSSVAFLPGLQSSRLYSADGQQLWEPSGNDETVQLRMDLHGESVVDGIHTQDVIEQANNVPILGGGQPNIYKSFIEDMEGLVGGPIYEFKSLPYDWRYGVDTVVQREVVLATTTYRLLDEIERLAKISDSGRVTLVAHSTGGLVGKVLIDALRADGKDEYIDMFVLVAVPQLGTPKAAISLLHGFGQDLPEDLGFFIDAAHAREIGRNMMSAYHLLPGSAYFDRVRDISADGAELTNTTLIEFDESLDKISTSDPYFNVVGVKDRYGTRITDVSKFYDFLIGRESRAEPVLSDTVHPIHLNDTLLASSAQMRSKLDNWTPPEGVKIVQIAGWGEPDTVRGFAYYAQDKVCSATIVFCNNIDPHLDIRPLLTFDGDGTVVLPSAVAMGEDAGISEVESYYLNLFAHNEFFEFNINRNHASILEVESVRHLIKNLLQNIENPSADLEYVFRDQEQLPKSSMPPYVRLSLHSPVQIEVVDRKGNRVGLSKNMNSDLNTFDVGIPNSYYFEFGEGKYVGIPLDMDYKVNLKGSGTGLFNLSLQEFEEGIIQETRTFANVPVSTTTVATLEFSSLNDIQDIALDFDADGNIDSISLTTEFANSVDFQTLIDGLATLDNKSTNKLVKKAENAKKQAEKGHNPAVTAMLANLEKHVRASIDTNEIDLKPGLRIIEMIGVLRKEFTIVK